MSISSNSSVPELLLEVNSIKKTVRYRNVEKQIPDTHWADVIVPALYPTWDTDKDKLVLFAWYSNNTYIAQRRKYTKNFKTGEYKWVDYEMEQLDESASSLYETFKDTFFLIDSLATQEYESEFAKIYAQTSSVSWLTVRLARNFLLDETDHVFVEDSPYSDDDKVMYKTYRQALRNLPDNVVTTDAIDVKFPMSPRYFKSIYLEKNAEATYLATEDQFLPMASHYLVTFKEKISSYLITKSITENLFFKSFLDALKVSGIVYEPPTDVIPAEWTEDQKTQETSYLDGLIKKVEEMGND
jgi:hypothetical protein